ncbi:nucleic acid binding protein [Elderberry carlavirus A]|uniref:nucleic acid binding protein n=1 Tax=Elderberry carlavirus A TaxID=1569052 RepID=UPI00054A85CB|nr:nucleic acid binding protein [Elderberry carlavirus A]AIZ76618.1 nucleic acid binding protein [Elderberry carlavirus A]
MDRVKLMCDIIRILSSESREAYYIDIARYIVHLSAELHAPGKSTFAKRRRAKSLGRCHRCYRISPGFYHTTKCDGISCTDSFGSRSKHRNYIVHGQRKHC